MSLSAHAGRTSLLLSFLLLGGISAVAQTGAAWATLGSGVPGAGVGALAFGPNGLLYVGGGFSVAGGVPSDGVATWDGSAWATLGGPAVGGGSCAFAFPPDGRVFAGGPQTLGGVRVNGIAEWGGAGWRPLGFGLLRHEGEIEDEDFYIASACTLELGGDGRLYAGGNFTIAWDGAGPEEVGLLASWDGTEWRAVGGAGLGGVPGPSGFPRVQTLVFGPDGRLYVGGTFTTAAGQPVANVAAWDGTAWDDLGGGLPGEFGIQTLAFGPDGRLYASGGIGVVAGVETDIAAWDGTAWAPVGPELQTPEVGGAFALAFSDDGKLYAGGFFTLPGGSRHVARLDGYLAGPGAGTWVGLGGGVSNPGFESNVQALAVGPEGEVYVGGSFDRVWEGGTSMPASNVAVWLGDFVVAGEASPPPGTLSVSVSPSPARASAALAVTLAASSPSVRVVIADALGRTVAVVDAGALAAGSHRLGLDVSRWAAGVYVARVTAGASSATRVFSVLR